MSLYLKFFVLFFCFIAKNTFSSQLDYVIPPEIKNDSFSKEIEKIASDPNIKNILEIGSSAGDGSTQAFVNGAITNTSSPNLFCLEISKPRFQKLSDYFENMKFVHCYNFSSISIDEFPKWELIEKFYKSHPKATNNVDLTTLKKWYDQDLDYMIKNNTISNGISIIKNMHGLDNFDVVLIDGSEFTGIVELPYIYGAKYILLDDINTFKNKYNFDLLKKDSNYRLYKVNKRCRNGYAIFKKND